METRTDSFVLTVTGLHHHVRKLKDAIDNGLLGDIDGLNLTRCEGEVFAEGESFEALIEFVADRGLELATAPVRRGKNGRFRATVVWRDPVEGPCEYMRIKTKPMPEHWQSHLQSCGWEQMSPAWSCGKVTYHLHRRSSRWRGFDDGDVQKRLAELGLTDNDLSAMGGQCAVIEDILGIKYDESRKQGKNIGSFEATRRWIMDRFLPRMLSPEQCQSLPVREAELVEFIDTAIYRHHKLGNRRRRPPLLRVVQTMIGSNSPVAAP